MSVRDARSPCDDLDSAQLIKSRALVSASNTLAVFGNDIISTASGYLNFGSMVGSNGYGFRDNAGTMEFKAASISEPANDNAPGELQTAI